MRRFAFNVKRWGLAAFIAGIPLFGIATAYGLNARLLAAGSGLAAVFGIALLSATRAAAGAARRRWAAYPRWARSGLHMAVCGVLVLTALQSAVVIGAIWYAGGSLLGALRFEITVAAAFVAAVWIATMAKRLVPILRPPATAVTGRRLEREEGFGLYQRVEQLAGHLGALPPGQIVVGLEAGIFTTDAKLACADGTHTGRTLYCSLPLIRTISHAEFDALAGHELRHPTIGSVRAGEASRSLAPFPARLILHDLDEAFAPAETRYARERELAADRDAARVAGPLDVASGCGKAHAMAELWSRIQRAAPHRFGRGPSPKNVSKAAAELTVAKGSILPLGDSDAASSWIAGFEALEEDLSARYELLVDKLPERKQSIHARRTALLIAMALGIVSVPAQHPPRVVPTAKALFGNPHR